MMIFQKTFFNFRPYFSYNVFSVDKPMVYLGFSLGLVLAVLGAIVGAMLRKRRQLDRNMVEQVAHNRLTNLRFTREAF